MRRSIFLSCCLALLLAASSQGATANKPPRVVGLTLHNLSSSFDGRSEVGFTLRLCDASKGRFRVFLTQQRMLDGLWQSKRSSFPLIEHFGGCFTYGFDRPAAWDPRTARMDRYRIIVRVRDSANALSNARRAELFIDD